MSLVRRRIELSVQLGQGSFGDSGADTVTVSGLRMSVTVNHSGGVALGSAQIRVYGMSLDIMNQLSILGKAIIDGRFNTVTVSAGDDDAGMSTVFTGTITEAWINANASPEVVFEMVAQIAVIDSLKPVAPYSSQSTADCATIMASFAQQGGYTFENGGVSVQLSNPYFPGTLKDQAMECARAGDFNFTIENNVFAIWPKNTARSTATTEINSDTGMVGYPVNSDTGIVVKTLYNPVVTFGSTVAVTSTITSASKTFTVVNVSHDLACETTDGAWFTTLQLAAFGNNVPIAQ